MTAAWQPISTLPDTDDLIWVARGDSIDGPRTGHFYADEAADYYELWAPCEPPQPPDLAQVIVHGYEWIEAHMELVTALQGTLGLIRKAQDRLSIHLQPDSSGDDNEAMEDLLYMFDGPEQREIEKKARAAIAAATA